MNTMIKAIVMAFSLFLFGANAYAAKAPPGHNHVIRTKTIQVQVVETKKEAYSLGFQKLQNLKKIQSGASLSGELKLILFDREQRASVTFEEANVTVQELMNEQEKIVYKGIVNVTYHYAVKVETN
jgi:hypothetical protein